MTKKRHRPPLRLFFGQNKSTDVQLAARGQIGCENLMALIWSKHQSEAALFSSGPDGKRLSGEELYRAWVNISGALLAFPSLPVEVREVLRSALTHSSEVDAVLQRAPTPVNEGFPS